MANANAEVLLKAREKRKSDRASWESHWDELSRVMLPTRRGFVSNESPGEERTEDIFDGVPMQAARSLANAIGSMLRSEKMFFVKTSEGVEDADEEAMRWLEQVREIMYSAIMNPRARFLQATGETDLDLVVFGTGVLYIGEHPTQSRLMFRSQHLKDVYIGIAEDGAVDQVFCDYHWTARQAMQRFPNDAGSVTKKAIKDGQPDKKVNYVQCVYPRDDYKNNAKLASDMPFASVWIEEDSKEIVRESGFHEFPFIVPRWDTASGEIYGRSPGMIALPDSNTLQAVGETLLVAGQRAADPALMFPDDGMISPGQTAPGGIGYYDAELARSMGGNPIFSLPTGANMPLTLEIQNSIRDQIFNAYFRNVFNLPTDGPQMTATEVIERKEQFIREIGAVYGRLEVDYTGLMIERVFGIMLRAGQFPPIPESLGGRNVVFEYDSPVRRAKQQIESMAASMWMQELAEVSKYDPSVLDNVDPDGYAKFQADSRGVPMEVRRSADSVAQIRQSRQKQQQAEQAAQMVERTADVAAKVPDQLMEQMAGGAQ
jgi:hypothetical protein